MDENYLDELNEQQRAAVEYCDGPQLVIAGAGSGKTRVLTYKIVHLLRLGHEPWRILALTFTNKAAREMRERIEQLVGGAVASKLWMGTFHSIFARILRANADRIGFKSNFTIYDSADSKSLVKTIIRDMQLDDKIYKPSAVLSAISGAKNALVSPEDYAMSRDVMEADARARRPELCAVYRAYRDRCVVAGAMDFDDLLYYTNVLLRDNPDILRHYREFFSYVLVDEYQDTNFAQHVIVTQLTRESGKLCVVGDDAQSIYSFRGANIRNILDLRKTYPALSTFKLERNYRSTRNIINAAGSLIDKNSEQIPKTVYSENETGAPIEVVKCYSDFEEAYQVASRLSQLKMTSGDSADDFAILYRTNAQSRVLEEALRKRNVPYRIYGGLSFYQRKEVKDAIAYFRLALNPDDDEALRRVINFPARGIGDTTLNKLTRAAIDGNVSLWTVIQEPDRFPAGLNSGTLRKLDGFASLIAEFVQADRKGADAFELATKIIDRTGLFRMYLHDSTPENLSKQENIQELLSGVKSFVETRVEEGSESMSLADFMAEVSLATDQDSDANDGTEERVTLMTVHAAKGLEFNNVFVVGVEEDLFPSAMSKDSPSQIEEERRLMYVAITRAKKFCMLSYAGSRFRNGQTAACRPSRFLGDIDQRFLRLATNDRLGGGEPRVRPTANYTASMAGSARSLNSLRKVQPSPSAEMYNRPASIPLRTSPSAAASGQAGGQYTLHAVGELQEGMRIEHAKFGLGEIIVIDNAGPDPRITVKFDNTDTRTLMLKFAKFSVVG
ncbi:MAG: UvrD-helicase domain-containing protein [Duncaniella sp.]|uniref:ATP-dependent helicase n=1 Tax=Duncaniella sp. TaxID=2518496 RepID=UPI0023BEFC75|nr:UvrD-helicase domain-containing protein [Duncaniella sp.]MDE5988489.1 UvrD-helicase domain-containing protein [Duncaniella sp.]